MWASALVKRYVTEAHSKEVIAVTAAADFLATSPIARTEVAAGFARASAWAICAICGLIPSAPSAVDHLCAICGRSPLRHLRPIPICAICGVCG